MRFIALLFSVILGGAALAFVVSPGAHAGSCTEPITSVNWTAKVNSGVNVRSKTCMEEGVVIGTLSGGSTVQVIGDAHGWYQVKMDDGTTGFVWNSFLTVTDKSGAIVESKKKTEIKEVKKTETVKKHTVSKETDAAISERLKGRILLQVEQNGEAWYVHPDDGKRFYMKDGDTAYDMMREFGLGITDADLTKLQAGDTALVEQLKGKIVLQVQQHGEAFYIHPETGKTHYLKDGKEAYRIMRELSLGITNTDLKKIESDDFEAFKVKKEKLREASKNVIDPSLNGNITLTAEAANGKVMLNWSVSDVNTAKGFKVVYATFPNPTFENGSPEYLSSPSARSHAKKVKETGFYHFRVCQYTGNGCGLYSNNVSLFVEAGSTETVIGSEASIVLSGEVVDGKAKLSWTVDGDTPQGFKVVYSKNANPTYPDDSPTYLSDANARSHSKFLGEGTYHFRVCRYTGDGCDSYSNNLTLTIGSTESAGNTPAGVDLNALNTYWLNQINSLRAERGLRQLVIDQRWVETATEWAVYMGENNSGTHNRPDGKSMHQWIDTKGLDFTTRHSEGGWTGNYFTENISWGVAGSGTTEAVKKVLDDTLEFYLAEASYNGDHYRTIYHVDWNSVGVGFHFTPNGNGGYKVYVAMHYGSLVL